MSAGNVLIAVFSDFKGVLLVDYLHERHIVNFEYYCVVLEIAKLAGKERLLLFGW